MKAAERTFSTVAEDHGNCSVGSLTHGFKTLDEVAGNSDVAALLDSGWVTMDVVPQIPVVHETPGAVTYGPLADTPVDPDVVFLRVTGRQLMVLSDAIPGLRIEGKPQCHIVAVAKEEGVPAASVGCALSRVRTGMPPTEMTCALPPSQLPRSSASIKRNADADNAVAQYAADDARRFSRSQPASSSRDSRATLTPVRWATSWRPRSRGCRRTAWSVTSITSVISGTESRIATSMPWLSVTEAMPQPWHPPDRRR